MDAYEWKMGELGGNFFLRIGTFLPLQGAYGRQISNLLIHLSYLTLAYGP